MPVNKDRANKLYDALTARGLNIGTREEYLTAMEDPTRRKRFHQAISQRGYDIGSLGEFESNVWVKPKEPSTPQGQQTAATTKPATGNVGDQTRSANAVNVNAGHVVEDVDAFKAYLANTTSNENARAAMANAKPAQTDTVRPSVARLMDGDTISTPASQIADVDSVRQTLMASGKDTIESEQQAQANMMALQGATEADSGNATNGELYDPIAAHREQMAKNGYDPNMGDYLRDRYRANGVQGYHYQGEISNPNTLSAEEQANGADIIAMLDQYNGVKKGDAVDSKRDPMIEAALGRVENRLGEIARGGSDMAKEIAEGDETNFDDYLASSARDVYMLNRRQFQKENEKRIEENIRGGMDADVAMFDSKMRKARKLDSKKMVEQIYESIPQDAIEAAVMSELKKALEYGQALDKDGVKEVGDFVNNKIANKIAQTIWDTATEEERKQWDSLPDLAKVLLEVTDFGIGDMVANLYYGDGVQGEQTARAMWDAEHPVLHGIGVAGNMAIDPVTYLGMGVAGKATEMAAKGAYRGLSTDIAKRAMASTLSGRMAMRGIGGGVNFGVYQGVHSMQDQLTNNSVISLSATLSAVGEGVALGATMGGAGGFIGNVGDRVVRGLEGTASKLTARGVQHGVGLATEATIFAMPEVMQGADFVDAWEDAMAMVLGFKIAGAAKGSLSVGEYLRQPQGRTEGRRQRNVLQNIADRLTAVKDDYLTAEEKEELKKYGYGDIVDMTHTAELERVIDDLDNANSGMVGGKGYLIGDEGEHPQMGREGAYRQTIAKVDGLNEYYDKLEQMLNDNRLSETARNKMLWVITGKQMRLSTITAPSEVIDNGDGTYTVEAYAQDGNAVVSSRRYASRKAAEVAQRDIAHQSELNTIDIGEKYNDGKVDDKVTAYAIDRVSEKYGVRGGNGRTANAIYDIYRRVKTGEEVSEADHKIAEEVDAAIEELKPYFADGRSEAIRKRIQSEIKNETGEDVDIDKALDKRNKKRSEAERKAIKAYADALYPERARNQEQGKASGADTGKNDGASDTPGGGNEADANANGQEQRLLRDGERDEALSYNEGDPEDVKIQMDADWQSRMAGVSDEAYEQSYEDRLRAMRHNNEVQYAFEQRFGMPLQDFLGTERPLRKIAKMRAEGASEEDIKLVYEACKAQAADQGAWQRIDDDMNIVANQTALQWQGRVHNDGKTIRVVTLANGYQAYVLSGEVHLREDGSIDTNASDATIVVSNSNTGEKEMVSPGKIASMDGEFDAEDFINKRVQEAKQQFRDKVRQDLESLDNADTETEQGDAQAEQGATPAAEVQNAEGGANAPQMEYGPGMITLKDGRRGFIMDYDPETGEYEYYIEGDLAEYRERGNGGDMTTHKATKEQLDAIVEGFTPDKIDNQVTTGETGNAEDISKTSMPQDKQEEPADESTGTITDSGEMGHDAESVAPTPVEAPQVNMAEDQASEAAQNPTIVGNTANGNAVDNVTNSGDAANVAPVPAAEVNAEGGATETPAAEGASAEAVEQVQSALARVPKDEKGKPQYHKAETAEIGWDALVESKAKDGRSQQKQEEMAEEHLQHMIDDAKKELKRLQDGKEKQRKGEDYGDYQERIESAKEDLEDYIAKMEAIQSVASERKAAALAKRLAADKAKGQEPKVESEAMSEHDRKWANRKKVVGRSTTRKIEDGTRVRGHWELVEAGTVLASHNPEQGYAKSEGYPVDANGNTVNDRDYERDKSAQQITQQMADQYDEAAIEKPVIVSNRGKVLSGNGRTMAGDMAARQGTDKDYVDYLRREAVVYGINPEDVDAYEHPRLVFVLDEDIEHNAKNMARFNKSDMKSQSPEAKAVKMGKVVTDQSYARILEVASGFDSMDQMYADRDAASEVMRHLQDDGVIEVVEREQYINAEGALTEAGKEMLEQVIVGKAFESDPDAVLAINDIKSMRRNVVTALAEINRNKMLGKEWGLEDAFTQAIELVREARLSRKVGEGDKASGFAAVNSIDPEAQKRIEGWRKPLVMLLADILNDKRSTLLKKVLSLYNQRVKEVAAGQSSMFGDDPQSREEAIYETLKQLGYDYEPTVRLAESQQRASQQAAEQPAEPTEPASTNGNGQDGASGRVSKESTGGGGVKEKPQGKEQETEQDEPSDKSLGTITGSGEKAEGNTLGGDATKNPRDGQGDEEKKAEKKHVAKYEAEMRKIIAETEDAMAENDRNIAEAIKSAKGASKKIGELAKLMGLERDKLEKFFTLQLSEEEADAMRKVAEQMPEGKDRDRAMALSREIADALRKKDVYSNARSNEYYTDYISQIERAIEEYRRNADEVGQMSDKELVEYVMGNADAYSEAQMDNAGHGNSRVEVAVEELAERSPKAGRKANEYLEGFSSAEEARKAIEDAIAQTREEERRNAERIAAAEKRYREAEAKEKQKAKERDELSKKAEEDFLAWAKANNVPTKIEDYPSKEDALKKLDEWKQQSDAYKEYKKARQEWGEALDEWAVALTSWGTGESMEEAKRRLYQDDKDAGLGKSPLEIAREIADKEDGKNVAKEPGAQYGEGEKDGFKEAEELETRYKEIQGSAEHQQMVEAAKKIRELEAVSLDEIPSNRDKKACEAIVENLENGKNVNDGREVRFVKNTVGKLLRHQNFDYSLIIPKLKELYDNSIFAISEKEILKQGHKDHSSNFVGYHHYVNKVSLDGKDYYVRFTVHETKTRKRDFIPNELHSASATEVKDIEIINADGHVLTGKSPATFGSTGAKPDAKLRNFFVLASENEGEFANRLKIATGWERTEDGEWHSNVDQAKEPGAQYGGNSGYVGYSMSKRAARAREEGRYPKTDFKKEYGVSDNALRMLTSLGVIDNSEWHHTSKYGNRTPFYGWAEGRYADAYAANKRAIDALARDYGKRMVEAEDSQKRRDEAANAVIEYLRENYDNWMGRTDEIAQTDARYAELRAAEEAAAQAKLPWEVEAELRDEYADKVAELLGENDQVGEKKVRYKGENLFTSAMPSLFDETEGTSRRPVSADNGTRNGGEQNANTETETDNRRNAQKRAEAEKAVANAEKEPAKAAKAVGEMVEADSKVPGAEQGEEIVEQRGELDVEDAKEMTAEEKAAESENISQWHQQSLMDLEENGWDEQSCGRAVVDMGDQWERMARMWGEEPEDPAMAELMDAIAGDLMRARAELYKDIVAGQKIDTKAFALTNKGEVVEYESVAANGKESTEAETDPLLANYRPVDKAKGEWAFVERKFQATGRYDFTGVDKVESPDDVAVMFRWMESAPIERAFAVLVKDGKPTVLLLGVGGTNSTTVDFSAAAAAIERIKPETMYFVHNHPSGNLKQSYEDTKVLEKMRGMVGDCKVEGIIIDTYNNQYSIYGAEADAKKDHTDGRYDRPERQGDANVRVYSFDESAYHMENKPDDEAITHPGAAARIIVGRTLGNGSKVSALILDRPGKAVANVVLEESDINGDTMERIAKKLATDAINFGGSSIIFYGDFPSGMNNNMLSEMDALTRKYGDVRTLDIMRMKGRNSEYKSLKDGGRLEAIKGKDEAREDGMLFRTSEELDAAKTDERKQKREAAEKIAAEINPDTKIADNGEGVKESAAWKRCQSVIDDANASEADKAKARELQKKLEREPGFYDTETGEVWINLDANRDAEDVAATMLHENAAHKGMREMVGEDRYDDFCVEIFNHMEDELKRKVMDKGYDIPKGVDELLGEMAEKPFEEFDAAERNLWQKAKDIVLKFIERFMGGVKIPKWVKLGDNELRYMLWRSHERMKAKAKEGKRSDGAEAGEGLLDIARDVAKKNELGMDIRFRDPGGETADIFKGGGLSMREKIANAALRLSNSNRADAKLRADAHQAVGESLKSLVHDMRNRVGTTSRFASADSKVDTQVGKMEKAQARYDRSTVKRMTDLANVLIRNHYLDNATSTEIGKVLGAIADAVGKEDIDAQVSKVMDVLIDNHLRRGEDVLDNLMHVRGSKVNASGVSVAGELDANGAEVMKHAKDGMKLDLDKLDEEIAKATNDLASDDNTKAEAAGRRLAGYTLAKDYHDMIKESEAEEIGLRQELENAADDKKAGMLSADAYRQLVASIQDAIRDNKLDRAESYQQLTEKVAGVQAGSIEAKNAWMQAQKDRAREVMHYANSDLEGKPDDIHHKETTSDAILNFANNTLLAPLATFEQMMRTFGSKSVDGEGYLWNHFVRGWVRGRNKEITGVREKFGQLDAKVAEVTDGEMDSWSDAITKISSKKAPASVSFMDGGEMREHELTQGNLMYIYMVDKMDDGRMKLRKMGIDEAAMDKITDMLDPRLRELADWMQDEFLVNTRNEYNETHKRLYGASMAAIENYFPLKIHKGARKVNEDVDKADSLESGAGTTVTGAIKNRVKNTVALDITGADAMNVILDHIAEMEHWNAFAEWGRDINTLLSYGKFRNRATNMHSAMLGTGEQAWDNVRNLCRIAAGTYHQKSSKLDRGALAIARGVTAAKVSFRVNTALKQLLSAPAYLPEVSAKVIYDSVLHPENPWNWCVENLPTFRERWESRISGDPRLKKTDGGWLDWRSNITQKAARLGMTPNAFVDALTVCIGAHAMYKTRLNRYLREGYSKEEAEERAKEDAAILYNQSQQSSENIFLSQIQANKDWLSTVFTVFRNSPMSYTRQVYDAGRNLAKQTPKKREEMVRFMAKQMVREGLDEDKAKENAERRVNRALLKDAARVGTFGFLLPVLWNMGGIWLYYLLGNDEKEKDAMMDDVKARIATAPIEGLTGGDVISNIVAATINNDWSENTLTKEMPISGDVNSIVRKFVGGKNAEGINEVINLMVQAGVGVNPQSLEDAVVGVINACGNDIELAHEASICIANVMNNPQSQIKKLYFDEIGLTGEEASKLTPAQLAERYAQAQVMRGRPLMPWTWDDEEALGREQAVAKKQIKERLNHRMSDEDAADYERYEDIYKTVNNRVSEATKASKSGYVEIAQQIAEGLKDDTTSVAIWNIYKQAHPVLMRITRKYMESGSVQESQYWLRELDNARGQMLDAMRQAEEAKDKAQE